MNVSRVETNLISFSTARTGRQQARLAGLNPNHWYAVEFESTLPARGVFETSFWGRSIAIFRGVDGLVRAVENRCAHRQVKLSLGEVNDCCITCAYHGWTYDGEGKLVSIPHELFGRTLPDVKIAAFPVRLRYGLIWIFPGNPALAESTNMPEIPELEGPQAWACVPLAFTWRAHHTMILENICDLSHAHLHRAYRPFDDAKLVGLDTNGSRIRLSYDVSVGNGRFSRNFVDRRRANLNRMELCFDYPYQWSNTGNSIKHWCFILPLDAGTTRAFFLFYFDALRIPFTQIAIPRRLMHALLWASNILMIRPLLMQDGAMVEAEQAAFETNPTGPAIEINPAMLEFQKLVVREWRRHLAEIEPQAQPGTSNA